MGVFHLGRYRPETLMRESNTKNASASRFIFFGDAVLLLWNRIRIKFVLEPAEIYRAFLRETRMLKNTFSRRPSNGIL